MSHELMDVGYLIAAVAFIMSLKLMNSPVTARKAVVRAGGSSGGPANGRPSAVAP